MHRVHSESWKLEAGTDMSVWAKAVSSPKRVSVTCGRMRQAGLAAEHVADHFREMTAQRRQ